MPSVGTVASVTVGLLAVGVVGAWLLRRTPVADGPPPRVVPLTRLAGKEGWPAFAPDGEQVAFAWSGEKYDNTDVYVTLVGSTEVRRLTTKYLLRRVARDLVPPRVLEKKKVGFFSHALEGWFSAQTRGLVGDYLLAPEPKYAEFLDRACVEGMMTAQANGTDRRHGRLLLAILMLEIWLSTYLPRALPAPSTDRITVAA